MQHLIDRDVVQHETHGFTGVQSSWHRHELARPQTDVLSVRAADRHRSDSLPKLDVSHTALEPAHDADEIPTWSERDGGVSG